MPGTATGGKRWVCERLLRLESGRVVGCFLLDDVHLVVVLEPSGGSLTYSLAGDGQVRRELTRFISRRLQQPVRELVSFRNRLAQEPYVCLELTRKDEVLEIDQRINTVRWPMDANAVETVDGNKNHRCIHSIEGAAVLSVSLEAETFTVETLTPLPLAYSKQTRQYTTIRQMYFIDEAPHKYKRPLAVAQGKLLDGRDDGVLLSYVSEDLPRTPMDAHEPSWSDMDRIQDMILELCAAPETALPCIERVCFEWSPAATYRWSSAQKEMQVSIVADGSMLTVGRNGFFNHRFIEGERWYAPDGVPRVIRCFSDIAPYELQPIADHAARLNGPQQQALKSTEAGGNPATSTVSTHYSYSEPLRVVEVQNVRGIGRFTYLSDDSVKVVFHDRTILSSDSGFHQCELISADDAMSCIVNTKNPCSASRYVRKAEQFLAWARKAGEPGVPVRFTDPDPLVRAQLDGALHALRAQRLHLHLHLQRLSVQLNFT